MDPQPAAAAAAMQPLNVAGHKRKKRELTNAETDALVETASKLREEARLAREQADSATKALDGVEAELKRRKRVLRLTPPFHLFVGALISGESVEVTRADVEEGRIQPDSRWTKVNRVIVGGHPSHWEWARLRDNDEDKDEPLFLTAQDPSGNLLFRNVELLSNTPAPIPVKDGPFELDDSDDDDDDDYSN